MLSWGQYLRGVSDGDPTNGNGCTLGDIGLEVYDPVDSNLTAFAQASRMKDRCARGDEYFIFDSATDHVSVGSNEAVVSDGKGMTRSAPENCVFHDDALSSDGDGPPSAMTCAPYMMRQPGPTVTLPQTIAFGATQAVGSICGETPSCLKSKSFSSRGCEKRLTKQIEEG